MKRVDINAVALRAGVSTSTVSRALRGLPSVTDNTRSLVEQAAEDLGYTVSASASSLSSGRHRMVAAVVPSLTGWYHASALEGADEAFRAAGYDLMLVNLNRAAEHGNRLFHTSVLRGRVDAVLVVGIDFTQEENEQLAALRIPHIGVGAALESSVGVEIDEAAAAELATDHLIALGHRRIAHVGGRDDPLTVSTMAMRRADGWSRAMARAGVVPLQTWRVDGGFTPARARTVTRTLLAAPDRPTAIFAASDEMAFGAMQAARDLGLTVPDDLSVIGIDDHEYAEILGLSTIRQRPRDQGFVAAEMLLQQLTERDPTSRAHTAPFELVTRGSTAPPRG